MGMVKATSMRSRMDIRNMPDNGEKAILVTKWQRSWLNCGLPVRELDVQPKIFLNQVLVPTDSGRKNEKTDIH